MRLKKRFLETRFALAGFGVLLRFYRWLAFGGFLLKHDARLVRLLRTREPAIFLCWHQDFPHTMGYLSRFNVRRKTYVLASASRDGGLAAAAAEGVGFAKAVRGSSTSSGAGALLKLRRLGASGQASLAVVGDGPRPPARLLKPGALHLASTTGLPLWLVRISWYPDASLPRTWARFHAPRPWHRGVVMADGPILLPPGLDREALDAARVEVEVRLNALSLRADAVAGTYVRRVASRT